jgi:dTDP-4-amino-4,6-dideoxygalactose transaminase
MNEEKLFIHGGEKALKKEFPWPAYDDAVIEELSDLITSRQWGNPDCDGKVKKFESEFAQYCGCKFALTTVNGSVALRIALIAAEVKPGDEVIIPPYTFIATASIVLETNCVPVFVDIDRETYNIDPKKIEEAITERTKAIIPVHFAGQACDMDAIMSIAEKHKLKVIEDACHAHGAGYKGHKLGTIGHAGCFSFQLSKNMTSGEGGIVVTDNEDLCRTMDSLRNVGRVEGGEWYEHHFLGCNYRITPLQAVLLCDQLSRLDEQTKKRDENGRYLNQLLSDIEGIEPLTRGHGETRHSHHIYIFRYDPSKFNLLAKEEFINILGSEGVPCFKGYPQPLYKQPLFTEKNFLCYAIPEYVNYKDSYCPVCEKACKEAVWILQNAFLGDKEDMEGIAHAINKIQKHQRSQAK